MQIENSYEWNTHKPILNLVMEEYKPQFVLELGCGFNSTPILCKAPHYIGIDNDKEWLETLQKQMPDNTFEFHDLQGVGKHVQFKELKETSKFNLFNYYDELRGHLEDKPQPRFLFVDQFTCARNISINLLSDHFDFIAFHDCQPEGMKVYAYDLSRLKDKFEIFILTSPTSWTGFLVSKKGDTSDIVDKIQPYIETYCKEVNLPIRTMQLKR